VRWSLSDQARHPNETNLDVHYVLPENGLWDTCIRARTDASKDILVQPRVLQSESSFQTHHELPSPRTLINNTSITPDNFHSLSNTPKPPSSPSPTVQPTLASALLRKLRWANIGWYYHWGTKQYDFTKGRGNVNNDVRDVCKSAVRMVDWEQVFGLSVAEWGSQSPDWKAWNETYGIKFPLIYFGSTQTCLFTEPDAGIVNFYQTKASLVYPSILNPFINLRNYRTP
jgi:alkylated DNA repair protein alkB family protein 1